MRGNKFRGDIKCPRCGFYDMISIVNIGREGSMCQKCGFIIENEKGRK